MKQVVDEYGEAVKPWDTLMARDGSYWTVTDLTPEDPEWQIGAVFEGGCADDDGDFFRADFFFCTVKDPVKEEADSADWRQEALDLWNS